MRHAVWLICLGITFAGCGGVAGPEPVAVSGHVQLKGKPLADVTVGFAAISEGLAPELRYASAVTDKNGDYKIEKVFPAEYMVLLNDSSAAAAPSPDSDVQVKASGNANKSLQKYESTSPLRAKVDATTTTHDFDLK